MHLSSRYNPQFLTPVSDAERAASRGLEVVDFINTFAVQTKDTIAGRSGEPLRVRDWQINLLTDMFAINDEGLFKHRTCIVGMPRKNGKSGLMSGVGLWSLFMGADGGEVYSCAADKEQARIVFGDAKKMIEADEELSSLARVFKDVIEIPSTGSVYRALSAEAFTKEGLNPTQVLFDELHAQPNRELWDVMQLAQGNRLEPMMIGFTTAGVKSDSSGQDSIAYQIYQHGQKVARGEVVDETFFMAWWEAPQEADHKLVETWDYANPALNDLISVKDFEALVNRTPEAEFRTKRCNQWVSSQNAWLPSGKWEELAAPRLIDSEVPVVLGFDGSFTGDASVIVGVTCEPEPYVFLVKAWEKQPTDLDDWRVDSLEVEDEIIRFCQTHNVKEIACDPFRWQRTMQVLDDAGLPVVEWQSTSVSRIVPACQKFYDAVTEKKMTHDGSPLIARHLSNAVTKTDRLGTRIVKEHRGSPRKIDAAVASIIGFDRATVSRVEEAVPMFYEF